MVILWAKREAEYILSYTYKNGYLILCCYSYLDYKINAYGLGDTLFLAFPDSLTTFLTCKLEFDVTFPKYLSKITTDSIILTNSYAYELICICKTIPGTENTMLKNININLTLWDFTSCWKETENKQTKEQINM